MFIPRRCPLCERPGLAPCASCATGLRRAGEAPPIAGLDSIVAVFAYDGAVRSVLLAIKYRNRRDALGWLAAQLARSVAHRVDAVTWAPTSAPRAGRRGYDQAELLARGTARHLRRPARGLLSRDGRVPQTGLDAAARRSGLTFGPSWRSGLQRVPARVLLVDDVATTGATLGAAAAALRRMGVVEVHGAVVAQTPDRKSPEHDHVAAWQA